VDNATARSLSERAEVDPLGSFLAGGKPIRVTSSGIITYTQKDALCVFLDSEGSCGLHRIFGPLGKGCICREFPLLLTETPDGIVVGYSFVCSAIREEKATGLPVPEGSGDDVAVNTILQARDHHYRIAQTQVKLNSTSKTEIDWPGYLLVEQGLLELLSLPNQSLGQCLSAGHAFLALLERFVRETVLLPGSPFNQEQILPHFVQRMKEEKYATVFRIAAKRRSSALVHRFVKAMGLSFLSQMKAGAEAKKQGRLSFLANVVGNLFTAKTPSTPELDSQLDNVLRRYVRHVIWRKDLVAKETPFGGGSLMAGYGGLLFVYALIAERARQLAAKNSPRDAALLALRQIERDLVAHARLRDPSVSSRLKWFLGWWETLVQRPAYVASMVQ